MLISLIVKKEEKNCFNHETKQFLVNLHDLLSSKNEYLAHNSKLQIIFQADLAHYYS